LTGLHPQNGLRDAGLDGGGQSAAPGRDAGEALFIEPYVGQPGHDNCRDLRGRCVARQVEIGALFSAAREERRADLARDRVVEVLVTVYRNCFLNVFKYFLYMNEKN
jgi:hypothetical protein